MIKLMKYTYILETEKIKEELEKLWKEYQKIIKKKDANWEELNQARAILFITGDIYCEEISVGAIEKRLPNLKEKLSLIEFFSLIDQGSIRLEDLRKDVLFIRLERFYRIIKEFKNKHIGGKFYLGEEEFIKKYNELNPDKELKIGYKGKFDKSSIDFLNRPPKNL